MSAGRLIAVVGPSGVGKDSVMVGIVAAMPSVRVVRRAITRAPGLGGEDYDALSETEFVTRREAGAFCLYWQAHGLHYGIPKETLAAVATGTDHLINLSRKVLEQASAVFPRLLVINLTARPETLAARMAGRGRENAEDIRKRLARSVEDFAPHLDVRNLSNDGPIEITVQGALALLQSDPNHSECDPT